MLIHRYVFREIAGPSLLGLLVYTCIMVVKHFFTLAAAWVDRVFTTADVLRQLVYLMPSILVLTIPMSVLLGILIGFSRLSADSEVTALRANGVSYYRLLAPTALLALLGWATSGAVYLWAVPWANTRVVEKGMEAQRRADLNRQVQPGAWVRLDEAAVFARGVDNGDPSEPWLLDVDVLLTHPGQPFREHWRADRARIERILSGEDRGRLAFQLRDVRITRWRVDQPEGNIQISSAEVGDRLGPERPLPTIAGVGLRAASKNPRLQRVDELRASLAVLDEMDRLDELAQTEPRRAAELRSGLGQWVIPQRRESVRLDTLMEIHKKFSIPAACLVFALAGMPLGIATRRGGRPASFLVSLGIIALWYLIFSATDAWVHVGRLEPAVGAWLPDVVLAVIGVYLLVRLRRQQRMSAYRFLHDALLLGTLVLLLFVGVFLSARLAQPSELRPGFPLWPPVAAGAAAAAWALVHLFRDPLSSLFERLGEAVRRPFVRGPRVREAVAVRRP
jgi:lipopolysaccharide export system permease protein